MPTNAPQQVAVPKIPTRCVLPSGRVFDFGGVVDCEPQPDGEVRLVQCYHGGKRDVVLSGDDAAAAVQAMQTYAAFDLRPRGNAPKIVVAPASALSGRGD